MLSPRALNREASIVIRKMIKQKAWLEKRQSNKRSAYGLRAQSLKPQSLKQWAFMSPRTKPDAKLHIIETEIVDAMRQKGWLIQDPTGALVISSAVNPNENEKSPNPPNFVQQHQLQVPIVIKDEEQRTIFTTINDAECPLGWMRARKDKSGKPLLDDFQFEAGERIRMDFTIAQLSPRITANWDFSGGTSPRGGGQSSNNLEMSEKVVAAKQRLFRALDVLGPEMSSIVLEICCVMNGLEAAERALGWPRRSGKLVLQIALTKLSQHYGIAIVDSKSVRKKAIRHWGQNGYQPKVPAAQNTSG